MIESVTAAVMALLIVLLIIRKHIMEKTKIVLNRWTHKKYSVLEITDKNVILRREDGSQFTIQKSEYFFSYSEKK